MKTSTIILGLLLILISCKSPSYLSKPMDFKYHVKGLFLETTLVDNEKILGEIIAVNTNEIIILPVNYLQGVKSITRDNIKSADIIVSLTSDNPKKIGFWAALTTVSTGAHGLWMIFTFPVSLTTSMSVAMDAAKGTYRIKYPDNIYWDDLSKFARFPQGIPENIELNRIK